VIPKSGYRFSDKIMRKKDHEDSPPAHKEGSGAPKRRISNPRLRGAAARLAIGALAFRRSTAALAEATERFSSIQAALHTNSRTRALPAPPNALKRCTPHPGRHAGGDDARTARERGYKPRPQEPHLLRDQVCLEITPLDEQSKIAYPNR